MQKLIREMLSDPHSQAVFLQLMGGVGRQFVSFPALNAIYPRKNDVLTQNSTNFRSGAICLLLLLIKTGAPGGQFRRVDL